MHFSISQLFPLEKKARLFSLKKKKESSLQKKDASCRVCMVDFARRYMAEILPKWRKTPNNQSIKLAQWFVENEMLVREVYDKPGPG